MDASKRLVSLDVFRGLTIAAMILVNFPGSWEAVCSPLEHGEWIGTTPADYIFPFFIFIVGISITLSFEKQIQKGLSKKQIKVKSVWRAVKIFGVGMALRLLPTLDFSRFELPGVLQRIALVFLACAFLFLFTDWKFQLFAGIGILVLYWIALTYIPVPGIGPGVLEPGKNLANWMDSIVIPHQFLNKKGYDSEGFLSTFPAIVSGISGLLAGQLLRQNNDRKIVALQLIAAGLLLVLLGNMFGMFFPVIKKIWTSSFVMVTSGWAFLVFAIIYWIIDIKEWKLGILPWIVFGSNAIAVYALGDIFETLFLYSGMRGWAMNSLLGMKIHLKSASLIWAFFSVLTCFFTALFLYRKKIFIKL
ncbi:MAG TPA: heparan-alpha-glucosaminide N-acetyltransferase domain-containing protein [Draconibacterium sp.]|nr:heparan-alpha-glucosaminide N-acetyltransferase domain-containing protein [Draconibacterium sp.]